MAAAPRQRRRRARSSIKVLAPGGESCERPDGLTRRCLEFAAWSWEMWCVLSGVRWERAGWQLWGSRFCGLGLRRRFQAGSAPMPRASEIHCSKDQILSPKRTSCQGTSPVTDRVSSGTTSSSCSSLGTDNLSEHCRVDFQSLPKRSADRLSLAARGLVHVGIALLSKQLSRQLLFHYTRHRTTWKRVLPASQLQLLPPDVASMSEIGQAFSAVAEAKVRV